MTSGATSRHRSESRYTPAKPLEIWGGMECTVNRVADRYFDQIALSRHADRIVEDLERFADLGIVCLRYPVLWERVAPDSLTNADWAASDLALNKMRELGITPIVGLVHHGSGPRHTSLIDRDFSTKLSEFAGAVARRYPWVERYTPINEPLTTARFATLYGHWYPHARDDHSFARAMLNQCDAIRESMLAVRRVNPDALLVQTEDLGKTYSTPSIAYQATFDNNRRWLTFDLLTGRVDEWHPLWWYLLESGITRQELDDFLVRPCVPDIIGINHYLTSDRFLDDRLDLYPTEVHGGNGRHPYADVEAVRAFDERVGGHDRILREAWTRYELPLAVTEVHLGCTREEQLRWLAEAWRAAKTLRGENVDIRAVTVWALLGSYGWCSLLTSRFDSYEPGPFDLRSSRPRATALAEMTRGLATRGEWDHPVLDGRGWWRRETRFTCPRFTESAPQTAQHNSTSGRASRSLLITGCEGTLGRAFQRIARARGLNCHGLSRPELDITNEGLIADVLAEIKPWAVVNGAGYVRVDDAEDDAAACNRVNDNGARMLGRACARLGIPCVTFSTDLVFDGMKGKPYVESDRPRPLNVYGAAKAAAEAYLLTVPRSLVIRTSAFFGPWDAHNFLATTFRELSEGRPVFTASDTVVSPTYVPDLVDTTLDLLIDGETGIWHLSNEGALTWTEFAKLAAERASLDPALIVGRPVSEMRLRAARPANSALGSERGKLMPSVENALDRWLVAVRSMEPQPPVLEKSANA